ncbi:ABC transporter permease, partial [Klebsiella pneumoniae]|nr:ABC transporter permease [Klebsiella pneumoniae]
MTSFVFKRLSQAVIVLIVMSILVFVGVYVIGNPVDVLISPDATQAFREQVIDEYGLYQPLWKQYLV